MGWSPFPSLRRISEIPTINLCNNSNRLHLNKLVHKENDGIQESLQDKKPDLVPLVPFLVPPQDCP
jgi:hypothetical protein